MSEVFSRFPDYIREYIYRNGWDSLRDIQLGAADVIFNTENNLLITSPTASGKTEAALFPMLTMLNENPSSSFGILYIAPLKSLINDQFERLDEILDLSGVPVYHWHGDVAASHKNKALNDPCGILQITPESLESMLMNRSNDIPRLFGDLRYIILDEIHTLTGNDRGNQIICQISRISRLIGNSPVRVGLSATLGDAEKAAEWLGSGSGRDTSVVEAPKGKTSWKLALEHFYVQEEDDGIKEDEYSNDPGFEYIYDCTKNKKSLVFSNSREETEHVTATLRQIASQRGENDIFQIHHGNLSAAIREEAETKLKNEELGVTCATVTLELGIDIGKLERIVHLESPVSVSSFLQRLGRSGRRGNSPEMIMVFREENPLPNTPLPQLMPWALLRAIAIIQLYIEERFIEPPKEKKYPFSLLFQQTISVLYSCGELTLKELASRVLDLPPFAHIEPEDYKELIVKMIRDSYLELTEQKTLLIGSKGERLTSSFKFYAVFKDSEDFTVRCGSDEIGTITSPPPVGDRFALAGRVWEVEELDIEKKLLFCHQVEGKMEISWPGDFGEVHTKVLERMKKVLEEDTVYPYLKPKAVERLKLARYVARNAGMTKQSLIHLGGYTWCFFPWLGTKSFRLFRKMVAGCRNGLKITNVEYEGCYYLTFRLEQGSPKELINDLYTAACCGIDKRIYVENGDLPLFEKYDGNVPPSLLRKAYAEDRLENVDVEKRIMEIVNEFGQH